MAESKAKKVGSYGAADITVLEGLEADSFAAPPINPFALTIQFKRE